MEFSNAIIRHILTAVGSYLVTTGYLQNGQMEQFVGAIAFLIAFGWSLYNKFTAEKAVETALELPAGSSKDKLFDVLKKK